MLVLTRKIGETIRIGDDVTVQVLEVRGGQVRLGLAAPSNVKIFREELFRAIENENRHAQLSGDDSLAEAETWEEFGDANGKNGRVA